MAATFGAPYRPSTPSGRVGSVAVEPRLSERGERAYLARSWRRSQAQGAMRGPGESYSDMTILRALKGDRAPVFASKRPALIEPALT